MDEVKMEIYNKREKSTTTLYVEKLSENIFRMVDNDIFNCKLKLGTVFETRLKSDGRHEIIKIIKESEFVTRRFFLTSQFKESEYRLLGEEIEKLGGFWQVDFGSIATINLPKDGKPDIDEIFKIFDFKPTEIIE